MKNFAIKNTIEFWLNRLPEPDRTEAFINTPKRRLDRLAFDLADALSCAFLFKGAEHGNEKKWHDLYCRYVGKILRIVYQIDIINDTEYYFTLLYVDKSISVDTETDFTNKWQIVWRPFGNINSITSHIYSPDPDCSSGIVFIGKTGDRNICKFKNIQARDKSIENAENALQEFINVYYNPKLS